MDEQNMGLKRSEFVTTLAWALIGITGLAAVVALGQMVMVWLVFPPELFKAPMADAGQLAPTGAQFLYSNLRAAVSGFFAVTLAALAGSIGLLRRRNWGRLLIIGLLGLAILWNFAGFGYQLYTLSSFSGMAGGARQLRPFLHVALAVAAVFLLAFSALFAWLIKKLLSAGIAAEFI